MIDEEDCEDSDALALEEMEKEESMLRNVKHHSTNMCVVESPSPKKTGSIRNKLGSNLNNKPELHEKK
jgi:hypothetical protein